MPRSGSNRGKTFSVIHDPPGRKGATTVSQSTHTVINATRVMMALRRQTGLGAGVTVAVGVGEGDVDAVMLLLSPGIASVRLRVRNIRVYFARYPAGHRHVRYAAAHSMVQTIAV